MHGDRILILAPHPDDEVVGCSAATARAQARGARVFVFFLTTGVPAREVLWPWRRREHPGRVARRLAEAAAVAERMGLAHLGCQDHPTRTLRLHLAETDAAIRRIIAEHGIDMVWVPAYEGGHQDHDTANYLASTLAGEAAVWEFAEYTYAGQRMHSQAFIANNGTEIVLDLTPEEVERKRRHLALYPSESGNLKHIEAWRECFRPLAAYDYGRPPHPEPLAYQRFQWVPFHHPTIDATRPREVCAAIAAHAAAMASE